MSIDRSKATYRKEADPYIAEATRSDHAMCTHCKKQVELSKVVTYPAPLVAQRLNPQRYKNALMWRCYECGQTGGVIASSELERRVKGVEL